MFPDGICRVTDSYYTKTVQFQDINYQLNQNEDKTAIFDGWCDFLNYFDSSVRFQLSFVNMSANKDNYARYITISPQGDDFDSIRLEYTQMLQNQLARGNNGLIKTKYLTFGVEADGLKAAKPRLERIETDILNNFKRLGVAAEPMNGMERLRLLHGMLRMDEQEPFRFSWDWLAPSGLSVKDFIAPSSFEFRTGRSFGVGRRIGCASFLQILAPELNDRMLADFLDMESSLIVSMHVQSVDQVKAIKTIKRKITDLQKMTIEEQKKAVRAGYDMDIIPSDLATYGTEAKKLLQDLQSRNERMFLLTFIVVNTAGSRQQLDNNVFQAASIAQKYNCQLTRLDFRQEEGLMSSLPLGLNQIEIQRGLTTSSVAIFIPFTTQELFQDGKVNYFWGGKSLVLGWDSRWGTTMQVTAPGSSSSGTYRPYGMDCSGYVDWVFYNATGGEYIIGHGGGASAQHTYCSAISWDEALPGDLVFYPEDSHVGIVGGRDESGNLLIIHCASGYNNVVITGIEGFTSIGRPVYFSD